MSLTMPIAPDIWQNELPDWVADLPSGWKVRRLKHIATVKPSNVDKKTVEGQEHVRLCNYVEVYNNDFITADMPFMEATATDSQIKAFALRRGDVLITKDSETWDDIAVPALVRDELDGVICGYHLAHISPHKKSMLGGYLFRAFSATGVRDQFRIGANGITRFGITSYRINNAIFPVPPLPEQHAIAEFLDRKTAEINGLIVKKQRLIDLLGEKRQALISHAVTKGLNPDAPMKDSGIEWLGEVPEHWKVERLKFCITKIEQGWSPQCESRPADEDEWGVLKVGCVNQDEFTQDEQKALPPEFEVPHRYEVSNGDILMSRGNTRELVGSAALLKKVRPRLLLCDLLYRFRARERVVDPQFLVWQLRSPTVRYQIERAASGTSSSMKKIGQETIRNFWIVRPPLSEQKEIIRHVNSELRSVDGVSAIVESQIENLREYRQTLISAAVTGKLDVKDLGAVAQVQGCLND